MTENELRERFETVTLRPEEFPHREHVRLAWTYLSELPLLDVLRIFPENLRRFATSIGKDRLYHETITWAYLFLIHERMQQTSCDTFEAFAAGNEDLFGPILERYYSKVVLESDVARATFVLPLKS